MGFALKMRGLPKDEIDRRVREAAHILGLTDSLEKKPRTLSGGQRQRVAMGRAIVRNPQAFLMDEPLSNLDAKLRVEMRAEISRIQRDLGVTTVYVTHDQTEAMTMGDRVAVMRNGLLQQVAAPKVLYERPRNLFVAEFIGSPAMNLVLADVAREDGGLWARFGEHRLRLADAAAVRPGLARFDGRTVVLGIRPEDMEDASLRATSDDHRLSVVCDIREDMGSEVYVHFNIAAQPVATKEVLEAHVVEAPEDAETRIAAEQARGTGVHFVARLERTTTRASARRWRSRSTSTPALLRPRDGALGRRDLVDRARPGRQRAGDEATPGEHVAELVRLAARAEPRRGGEERESRDEDSEDGAEGLEPGDVGEEGRRQEGGADHVREPRRPCVLEDALAEDGLHELEVRQARQAVAAAEREADDELDREQREEPRPAGDDRRQRERSDDDLIEARCARVDDVEIPVRIRSPLRPSLHFGKYCSLRSRPGCERVEEPLQPQALARQHVLDVRRAGVAHLAPKDAGTLELGETLHQRRRRDGAERMPELGEARAPVVRGVQDRDGIAPLEDVRRAADVLGNGLESLTPRHWAARERLRARGPAPRRST